MKKLLLLIFILSTFIFSCSESENSKTYCWEFTYTTITTMTGSDPTTSIMNQELCNLTEGQANNLVKSGNITHTSTSGEITITITTTVTKKRK